MSTASQAPPLQKEAPAATQAGDNGRELIHLAATTADGARQEAPTLILRESEGNNRPWRYTLDSRRLANHAERHEGTFPAGILDALWTALFATRTQILLLDIATASIGAVKDPTAAELASAQRAPTSPYSRPDGWPLAGDVLMFFERPERVRLLWCPGEQSPRTGGAW